jgi:hypothetical protein
VGWVRVGNANDHAGVRANLERLAAKTSRTPVNFVPRVSTTPGNLLEPLSGDSGAVNYPVFRASLGRQLECQVWWLEWRILSSLIRKIVLSFGVLAHSAS